ncbi:hypothetical protein BDZ45DRAFT_684143 [Acephala macrosclerotiorum]|nr:hypothetical protein BDZ45DRAFT_684143 [Acephala macrosclerotiorum]
MSRWASLSRVSATILKGDFAPLLKNLCSRRGRTADPSLGDWEMVEELVGKSNEAYARRSFHYLTTTLGSHLNQLEPSKPGFFSLSQPPSTWYHTMFRGEPEWSIEARMKRSIEAIQKEHGFGGLFQVLLWATSLTFSNAEADFWREVEKFVLSSLGDENYLVLFQGCGKELNEALGGSAHLGEFPALVDEECFYIFQVLTGGFECIPTQEQERNCEGVGRKGKGKGGGQVSERGFGIFSGFERIENENEARKDDYAVFQAISGGPEEEEWRWRYQKDHEQS